jgi:hypothetical protein
MLEYVVLHCLIKSEYTVNIYYKNVIHSVLILFPINKLPYK